MKKFVKVLLCGLMAMSMVAGAAKPEESTEAAPAAEGGEETAEVMKVAILLPNIGDQSYMDVTAHAEVLLEEAYSDVQVDVIEMGKDEKDWEPANRQAAEAGYDVIVSGNWQYEGAMLTVAKDYPEIKYVNFDYSDVEANALENVYAVTYASNEIGYLAGVVAAVKSKTGIIGGIGGMDNAGIQQFMTGFLQGASEVNPDIQVILTYVGSFSDAPKAKEIAANMIKDGADVIWGCAGGSGNGNFEAVAEARAAGEEGIWAVGVDCDQYVSMSAKPELAETILTSGLKKCDVAIFNAVTAIKEGNVKWGTAEILGYTKGGVGLAENDYYKANMTEEELAKVNECIAKLESGETVVADSLVTPESYTEYVEKYTKK